MSSTCTYSGSTNVIANGTKSFAGTIDRLQLLMSTGTDTFNGGTMNIMWE
jgi:hypothetical protein